MKNVFVNAANQIKQTNNFWHHIDKTVNCPVAFCHLHEFNCCAVDYQKTNRSDRRT